MKVRAAKRCTGGSSSGAVQKRFGLVATRRLKLAADCLRDAISKLVRVMISHEVRDF